MTQTIMNQLQCVLAGKLIFSIAILPFYELDPHCISISVSCDKSVYIDLSIYIIFQENMILFSLKTVQVHRLSLSRINICPFIHTCTCNFECTPTYIHKDIRKYRQAVDSLFSAQRGSALSLDVTWPRRWKNDAWRKKETKEGERKERLGPIFFREQKRAGYSALAQVPCHVVESTWISKWGLHTLMVMFGEYCKDIRVREEFEWVFKNSK